MITPSAPADRIEQAADLIAQSDAVVIAAGAGIGVDSGLPDFRGNEGLWKAYPALRAARLDFTEVASPRTFRNNERLAWGFYGHRLKLYRDTVPHAGFDILKRWAEHVAHGAFVFTSNVDGQFQKAGFAEARIHECHGSIHHVQCAKPCTDDVWAAAELSPRIDLTHCRWLGDLPACPRCGGGLRPNILMFGDSSWLGWRSDQQQSLLASWLEKVRRPVVIEVGAGTRIPTVRSFGHSVVVTHGGRLLRINQREADVPGSLDIGLPMGALEGLSAIDAALRAIRP